MKYDEERTLSLSMATKRKNHAAPIGRFIDPLTDFGFKRIFASEPNKNLWVAFLNELIKGRKAIRNQV